MVKKKEDAEVVLNKAPIPAMSQEKEVVGEPIKSKVATTELIKSKVATTEPIKSKVATTEPIKSKVATTDEKKVTQWGKKEALPKQEDPKMLAIMSTIASLEKKYGRGTVMEMGSQPVNSGIKVVPSGSILLDIALGIGGYPRGRIVEFFGEEACVCGDSHINYQVRVGGRTINNKGETVKRLYERFNNQLLSNDGRGKALRSEAIGAEFFVPSLNEEDRIFQNQIEDVVHTGEQECYELTTVGGYTIIATGEHRFFTGTHYVSLQELKPGDIILMHTNTPFEKEKFIADYVRRRGYIYVKHHPIAGTKNVTARISRFEDQFKTYQYKRLLRSRAVVEADMNGLSLEDYINRLNSGVLEGLIFLNRDDHVHHKDECVVNDDLDNLIVIRSKEHTKLHALDRHNNLRFVAIEDYVASIKPVGLRETFDIRMTSPFNNYIVNNFVTHNSGKTTLALHAIANVQKEGGRALFIDVEHALDPLYASNLGVDLSTLLITQPDYGEQALDIAHEMIQSNALDVVVVDSVAALVPKSEFDGDMGDSHVGLQARLMGQAMRKLAGVSDRTKTLVVFINQLRSKIGVIYGSNSVTTGGNALKFFSSVRLDIKKRATLKEGETPFGNVTEVTVVKNKMSPPFKKATFDVVWGRGIVRSREILAAGTELEVISKAGSFYSYQGEKLGQGINNAVVTLESDLKLMDLIEKEIREVFRKRKEKVKF